jgi:asparagine synthase (glutamine-hydrolysing)
MLFAARDRFGIKPLYYAQHRNTLYLASELKSLLAAGVPRRWDHATFLQGNHLLVTPEDRTLFDGILQVPPGHFLIASRGDIRLIRYWDFDYPVVDQAQPVTTDYEYAARFRQVLD